MSAARDVAARERSSRGGAALALLLLAASRLPLLGNGYGSDNDTWRNVVAALHMRQLGRYVPSRVPGFPVYEGLLAALVPGGWIVTNLASALAGIAAALLFWRLLAVTGVRQARWAWLAFAFGAPLWVQCTQTIDYAFGLACFLALLLALLERRHLLAGVLLALATGCRPGYVGALPAVAFLLIATRAPLRAWAAFACGYTPLAAAFYVLVARAPEARDLGGHFARHVASHVTATTLRPVLQMAVVYAFGKLGVCVAALAVLARLVRRPAGAEPPLGHRAALVAFAIGATLGVGGLYLLIPGEGAYVLPLLPLAWLGLAAWLPRRWMIAVALAALVEPWLSIKLDQRRLVPGALFEEIALRRSDLADTRALLAARPTDPTVYVVGRFGIHRLLVLGPGLQRADAAWSAFHAAGIALRAPERRVAYAESLDAPDAARLVADGWRIETRPDVER